MCSEWFGKKVRIEKRIPLNPGMLDGNNTISDFLTQLGYREICSVDSNMNAVRGRKIWNLFNIGDPRRLFHSTEVLVSPGEIVLRTDIDTWFGLGTKYDRAIFVVEVEMLINYLQTKKMSRFPLEAAQSLRRKSDLKTLMIFIGVGIILGIATVVVLS